MDILKIRSAVGILLRDIRSCNIKEGDDDSAGGSLRNSQ
jgi:hypothetical protein